MARSRHARGWRILLRSRSRRRRRTRSRWRSQPRCSIGWRRRIRRPVFRWMGWRRRGRRRTWGILRRRSSSNGVSSHFHRSRFALADLTRTRSGPGQFQYGAPSGGSYGGGGGGGQVRRINLRCRDSMLIRRFRSLPGTNLSIRTRQPTTATLDCIHTPFPTFKFRQIPFLRL